jgi:hypothetical protein
METMNTRASAPAHGLRARAVQETGSQSRRRGLKLISYGIVMGPITTALGAFLSQRLTGATRITVWLIATALLAIAAIFAAKPGLVMLDRCLRPNRDR